MSGKEPKLCIRCGCPRPENSLKYCADCREIVKRERDKRSRTKQYLNEMAFLKSEKQKAPKRQPPKRKPTPDELEAAERAKSKNGWISKDVVVCKGCRWYSTETHTCDYILNTGKPRPRPNDCYKHNNTPYERK